MPWQSSYCYLVEAREKNQSETRMTASVLEHDKHTSKVEATLKQQFNGEKNHVGYLSAFGPAVLS